MGGLMVFNAYQCKQRMSAYCKCRLVRLCLQLSLFVVDVEMLCTVVLFVVSPERGCGNICEYTFVSPANGARAKLECL